jgi:hypothetical protein
VERKVLQCIEGLGRARVTFLGELLDAGPVDGDKTKLSGDEEGVDDDERKDGEET